MASAKSPLPAMTNPIILIEDFSRWFAAHWMQISIAVGAGILIYLALGFLRSLTKKLCQREHVPQLLSVVGRAAQRTSHIFMMVVSARLVSGYANPPELIMTTVRFLFTVMTVVQVAIWVREIILGIVEARSGQEGSETLANAMGIVRVLISFAVFAIAAIVILDNLGVNVTGLIAGLGIGGIAIGLAAQGIFSDLFASLSIIFDKPFKVGDAINFGTQTGVVEKIGLKSTRLRAITGERMIVSNSQLLNKDIMSYAHLDHRRLRFAVGVIYQTAPEQAAAIPDLMREVIEAEGGLFVRCGFIGFGPSSLDFEVEFDVFSMEWDEIYAKRHAIGLAILRRFNEVGLEFAYPTQTTFTADPSGKMILPYPARQSARRSTQETSA